MKKQTITLSLFLMAIVAISQTKINLNPTPIKPEVITPHSCGTEVPPKEWDDWFNNKVEAYKHKNAANKVQSNFTIPVIVHVIHRLGIPVGMMENVSQAQVQSQIDVLNKVFSGSNGGVIPAVFQSVNAGNTGIQFCLVTKDPNGNTLPEPGIERINLTSKGWTNPSTLVFDTLVKYYDNTIKPGSIWDPTKYFNIWVTDMNSNSWRGGFSTFPVGAGLNGIGGETNKISGVVIFYRMFGSGSTIQFPIQNNDKGMNGVHEVGHYLGLRHIGGDVICGNDFCNDTPPQSGGYSYDEKNGQNYGCPPAGWQGKYGLCAGNTFGQEMYMNYMDYTNDACMSMFSADQKARMLTAMTFGTYRKFLGMDGFCNTTPAAPVANFTFPQNICNKSTGYTFSDASQNKATSWLWSVTPAGGVSINGAASQNPNISFTTPGTYQLTLKATNSIGNSSETKSILVSDCIEFMCDTLNNNIKDFSWYYYDKKQPIDSGYFSGINFRKDKAIAEMYTNTSVTKKLKAIYTAFLPDSIYKGNNFDVKFNVWSDVNGKPGNILASQTVPLYKLPLNYFQAIEFQTPVAVNGKYYIGFEIPQLTNNTNFYCVTNDLSDAQSGMANTGWVLDKNNQWLTYAQHLNLNTTRLSNAIYPILCESASTVGIEENNSLEIMSVYPNPGTGLFHFRFPSVKNTDITYSVLNALGQSMQEGKKSMNGSAEFELNLSQLPKGVYFVRLCESVTNINTFARIIIQD